MKKLLLAATAAMVIPTPAAAQSTGGYVGIEGGIMAPRPMRGNARVDYTTTQTPATPTAPAAAPDTVFVSAYEIDYRRGVDVDVIAGYDFGAFRLEGELGWKRARIDELEPESPFLASLNANTALNRPSSVAAGDPGAPGLPAVTAANLQIGGRMNIISAMANALVDVDAGDVPVSFYAGGGFGRAWARFRGDEDSAWAWQLIAGLRYAVSPNIDVGLKYRFFRTGKLQLVDEGGVALQGNPRRFVVSGTEVFRTTNAVVSSDFDTRFRSHSLLASLIFNFGRAAPLPPPPPPPPMPERG
ncbi:MAG TPA: outer membrane beta-barrel protein [Sphingomicrobium sp.]|nr:outer membrane beta-barrel protein [Sphingomicrobium sp.]